MKVNEIFTSIDGEGIRAGYPVTFIRLCKCNMRCSYCDTPYAFTDEDAEEMSVSHIIERIRKICASEYVTITGGEPLAFNKKEVVTLIMSLIFDGFKINIETNGSIGPPVKSNDSLFYTMDYKCKSSGMNNMMSWEALESLTERDVLKFVVGNKEDLDEAREVVNKLNTKASIFISPVFGQIDPKEIVNYIIVNKMHKCRVQLQLHKFIWDPNQKGV